LTPELNAKLGELRAKANELELRASDLQTRAGQLADQRGRVDPKSDRSAFDKQFADVRHEIAATTIQLEATKEQIKELQTERDMARAFSLQGPSTIATTAPPPPFPEAQLERERMIGLGALIVLLPLALAFARRIWHRGSVQAVDLENSPRLQRIEQAIESIALEVERIGEAQRFTTKLLADRQPDAVARMAAIPRKEPGTITPH
jgi:hypothetical protein